MENASGKSGTLKAPAIFFFFIGLSIFILSTLVPLSGRNAEGDPGSLLLPYMSGTLLVGMSLIIFYKNHSSEVSSGEGSSIGNLLKPLYLVLIPLIIFISLFQLLGALLSICLLIWSYLLLTKYTNKMIVFLLGAAASLFICFIFGNVLRISLPGGVIGWP